MSRPGTTLGLLSPGNTHLQWQRGLVLPPWVYTNGGRLPHPPPRCGLRTSGVTSLQISSLLKLGPQRAPSGQLHCNRGLGGRRLRPHHLQLRKGGYACAGGCRRARPGLWRGVQESGAGSAAPPYAGRMVRGQHGAPPDVAFQAVQGPPCCLGRARRGLGTRNRPALLARPLVSLSLCPPPPRPRGSL